MSPLSLDGPAEDTKADNNNNNNEPDTSMSASENVATVHAKENSLATTTANNGAPVSTSTMTAQSHQRAPDDTMSFSVRGTVPSSSSLSVAAVVTYLNRNKALTCVVIVLAAMTIGLIVTPRSKSYAPDGSTYSGGTSSTSTSSSTNRWSYTTYGTSAPYTSSPTHSPTYAPTTRPPTLAPTTRSPTKSPTLRPTHTPTMYPTQYIKAITSEWDVRAAAQKEYLHQHEGQIALAVAGMVFLLLGLAIATLTHGHMCYSGMETVTERDEELLYQRYNTRRAAGHVHDSSSSSVSSLDHSTVRNVFNSQHFFGRSSRHHTPEPNRGTTSDLGDGLLGLTIKRSYSGRAECNTLPP